MAGFGGFRRLRFRLDCHRCLGPRVRYRAFRLFRGFWPVHGRRERLCGLWAVSHGDYREPPRVRHRLSRRVLEDGVGKPASLP